ncbi:MAG TPA: outer membrane beta-barrel protein [Burkholderiales bacterium]|nr:outer membrane beta-barrel protein [Burkholderiales bacterium]
MIDRKHLVLAALAAAIALPATASLADSGVYIGGGVSRTKIEDSTGNPGGVDFNETGTGGKGFIGYHIDAIPLVKFAAEAGYRDSGHATDSTAVGDVKYNFHGFDYAVLAGVGLGPVDIMGRVGGISYKLKKDIAGVSNDYDGTAPVYGLGVWFTILGVGVRAEYERIHIDELDKAQAVSLSAFYQF